jgi:hypothetical protein
LTNVYPWAVRFHVVILNGFLLFTLGYGNGIGFTWNWSLSWWFFSEFRQSFWGPVQWETLSNLKLDDRKTALQFYQHLLHSLPFPTLLQGYSKLILNCGIHLITNLSSPINGSVNDFINTSYTSVQYSSFDRAVVMIKTLGFKFHVNPIPFP